MLFFLYIFITIRVIFSTQCEFSRVIHYLVLHGEDIFFNNDISKQDNCKTMIFTWSLNGLSVNFLEVFHNSQLIY